MCESECGDSTRESECGDSTLSGRTCPKLSSQSPRDSTLARRLRAMKARKLKKSMKSMPHVDFNMS